MNLTPQDWRKLTYPLLGLGLAIVVMTLLVGYVQQKKLTIQESLNKQQGLLNQARQHYQTSGQEKEIIIKYLPVYNRLIKEGWIGEERRIDWVDNLRNIHQQHKLYGINYSIGAQEVYKPAFTLNLGPFTLHRSVMKMDLSMLHEGDLLTLIETLNAEQTAPFILRQCEINRLANNQPNKLVPNLLASCELDWLTIQEPQIARVSQ